MYPKFKQLVESYRFIYGWDTEKIINRSKPPPLDVDTWFFMKDLAVNCVYASGWRLLGELALELNDQATHDYCMQQSKISTDAIVNKMWISEQGHFNSLYIDDDGIEKHSIANTIQNLFPLLLKDLPTDKKDLIVSQLKDPSKFFAPYSIPTVAMDDPQFWPTFDADLMWRGPVWGFTNWFVLEGLALHNEYDLQSELVKKWISVAQLSGIYEQYNPFNGEPYG